MTDEKIVSKIQKGNIADYKTIMERYEKQLFVYIVRLINRNDEEAEELLEEVFINSYEKIQSFDCRKKFSTWIYRIAHNKAVDYVRASKRRRWGDVLEKEEFWAEEGNLIEDLEIEKEERRRVRKSVLDLEQKYREVIWLYYFENKSYEEMSDILHKTTSNIGVLLHRAKIMLKNKLE